MAMAKTTVQLGSKQDINYLMPKSILEFATISLVSFEGITFLMDKTMLAAGSKLLCNLLLNQEDFDEKVVLHTQITTSHLSLFCQFVCTGILPSTSFDPNLVSSFKNLGIDLEGGMKLETISAAALPNYELHFSVPNNEEVTIKKEVEENVAVEIEENLAVENGIPISNNSAGQYNSSRNIKEESGINFNENADGEDPLKAEDSKMNGINGYDENEWQIVTSLVRKKRGKYKKKNKPIDPEERPLAKAKKRKKMSISDVLEDSGKHQLTDQPHSIKEENPLAKLKKRYEHKRHKGNWDCNICKEKCTSSADWKEHINKVHADILISCEHCDLKFQQVGRLKRHIQKVHIDQVKKVRPAKKLETTVCICCGAVFETVSAHRSHVHRKGQFHNDKCAYKECADLIEFKSWPEHEDHIKKVHGGEFLSRCDRCPEVFENDFLLKQHEKKDHTKRRIQPEAICVHCGKSVFKYKLQDHIESEHIRKEHPCNVCNKIFYSEFRLHKHQKNHIEMHSCPHCEKFCPSQNSLRAHILNSHTPDHLKPHRCPHCPKGFYLPFNLQHHIYTHTGEKPYKCHICDAAFNLPGNLRAHIKGSHEGIKRKK